jgi:hypothetical protein
MAITKPSKRPARPPRHICTIPEPSTLQTIHRVLGAMLSLVALGRHSEPPPGRSKPWLEWEKQIADAKKKAVKALRKDQHGEIDEACWLSS